jgi:cytosolic carboxypeptidase protein 5
MTTLLCRRFYLDPCARLQPGIYALRTLLQHLAAAARLHLYLDLHAHANRQGVFAYGNALQGSLHVDALLYTKLAALNSPHFDFGACNFSERNMTSKERDGMLPPRCPHACGALLHRPVPL